MWVRVRSLVGYNAAHIGVLISVSHADCYHRGGLLRLTCSRSLQSVLEDERRGVVDTEGLNAALLLCQYEANLGFFPKNRF